MKNSPSSDSVTFTGLKELRAQGVASSKSYTAKLVGRSGEEAANTIFDSLVDAIHWATEALENGALAKQANIYSNSELIWSIAGSAREQLREIAMKRNAERILAQSLQSNPPSISADESPLVPE